MSEPNNISAALNSFLVECIDPQKSSSDAAPGFTISHVRAGAIRQDDTEVFARKLAGACKRFNRAADISISVTEISGDERVNGMGAMATAAAAFIESSPAFSRYAIGEMEPLVKPPIPDIPVQDIFSALHSYGHHLAAKKLDASNFGSSNHIASIALRSSGVPVERLGRRIAEAVDSVFSQSFADSFAVIVIAARDGKDRANSVLDEVCAFRERSGDYGAFSLAPLSHDTSSALIGIKEKLSLGADYSKLDAGGIWDTALDAACMGTESWLRKHGVEPADAVALSSTIRSMSEIICGVAEKNARKEEVQVSHRKTQGFRPH